ncbi:MBL fold metallo-hydrolase [Paracraurococcus ruber]|uniref:Metallo-beta-lactamase domain-containing protein n=1 Tax=Paracraurococcus ruber TaxID=77675 RepID=A0ABS1D6H7_9PROT|nr:hypothetical protein [Paracraurococcus ruber]TDG30903.1 MBL fold metallo-hydrolase [Paracraurococcus ruber]
MARSPRNSAGGGRRRLAGRVTRQGRPWQARAARPPSGAAGLQAPPARRDTGRRRRQGRISAAGAVSRPRASRACNGGRSAPPRRGGIRVGGGVAPPPPRPRERQCRQALRQPPPARRSSRRRRLADLARPARARLRRLDLDPAQVKRILVTHGHGDHSGGAAFLKRRHGAQMAMSGRDWTMLETGLEFDVPPRGARRSARSWWATAASSAWATRRRRRWPCRATAPAPSPCCSTCGRTGGSIAAGCRAARPSVPAGGRTACAADRKRHRRHPPGEGRGGAADRDGAPVQPLRLRRGRRDAAADAGCDRGLRAGDGSRLEGVTADRGGRRPPAPPTRGQATPGPA